MWTDSIALAHWNVEEEGKGSCFDGLVFSNGSVLGTWFSRTKWPAVRAAAPFSKVASFPSSPSCRGRGTRTASHSSVGTCCTDLHGQQCPAQLVRKVRVAGSSTHRRVRTPPVAPIPNLGKIVGSRSDVEEVPRRSVGPYPDKQQPIPVFLDLCLR